MASAVTKKDTITSQHFPDIQEWGGNIDAGDTVDLATPANSGNRIFVIAANFSDGTATNLTFGSGAGTKTFKVEMAANQGRFDNVCLGKGYLFAGKPGEKVTLLSSGALSDCQISLVEAKYYDTVMEVGHD